MNHLPRTDRHRSQRWRLLVTQALTTPRRLGPEMIGPYTLPTTARGKLPRPGARRAGRARWHGRGGDDACRRGGGVGGTMTVEVSRWCRVVLPPGGAGDGAAVGGAVGRSAVLWSELVKECMADDNSRSRFLRRSYVVYRRETSRNLRRSNNSCSAPILNTRDTSKDRTLLGIP